ncbi:hypothetical protein BG418_34390 [Streptomyces sp. CBMA152]|nr:hypothetical protein [Streptomyces sp. CBMA152]
MSSKAKKSRARLVVAIGVSVVFGTAVAAPAAAADAALAKQSAPRAAETQLMQQLSRWKSEAGRTTLESGSPLARADLRAALDNLLTELRNLLKGNIDKLVPDAKAFVTSVIETVNSLRPTGGELPSLQEVLQAAQKIVKDFQALSAEAQDSLRTNFPKTFGIIMDTLKLLTQ